MQNRFLIITKRSRGHEWANWLILSFSVSFKTWLRRWLQNRQTRPSAVDIEYLLTLLCSRIVLRLPDGVVTLVMYWKRCGGHTTQTVFQLPPNQGNHIQTDSPTALFILNIYKKYYKNYSYRFLTKLRVLKILAHLWVKMKKCFECLPIDFHLRLGRSIIKKWESTGYVFEWFGGSH